MVPEHPADLPKDRRLWFGPEVEGSVALGAETAFVSAELTDAELALARARLAAFEVEHVFLTETFGAWPWYDKFLRPYARRTAAVVTVGRYPHQLDEFFALPYVRELRLMVHVLDAPWVHRLRAGDEVALGVPYHLWVYRLEDGVEARPEHYKRDHG